MKRRAFLHFSATAAGLLVAGCGGSSSSGGTSGTAPAAPTAAPSATPTQMMQVSQRVVVAVDREGVVFKASPAGGSVARVAADGTPLWTTGPLERPAFDHPVALAVDATGRVFVVDRGNGRVVVLDAASGRVLFSFGSPGTDVGQFYLASSIALGSDRLYVSDQQNHRVSVFSYGGSALGSIAGFGLTDGQLNGPRGVALDPAGNLYVANNGSARIQIYRTDGSFVSGIGAGLVRDPRGLAFSSGNLYVADGLSRRVVVLSPQGALLEALPVALADGRPAAPFAISTGAGQTLFVHASPA